MVTKTNSSKYSPAESTLQLYSGFEAELAQSSQLWTDKQLWLHKNQHRGLMIMYRLKFFVVHYICLQGFSISFFDIHAIALMLLLAYIIMKFIWLWCYWIASSCPYYFNDDRDADYYYDDANDDKRYSDDDAVWLLPSAVAVHHLMQHWHQKLRWGR